MKYQDNGDGIVSLSAEIVSAYVSKNPVPISELPSLIGSVHRSLLGLGSEQAPAPLEPQKPAVNPKKSIHDDHLVCLEDGKKFKSLKRHLMTHFGMSPTEYRQKWNLPANYPMVAPGYAAQRSALALKMGLGRKPKDSTPPAAPAKRTQKTSAV